MTLTARRVPRGGGPSIEPGKAHRELLEARLALTVRSRCDPRLNGDLAHCGRAEAIRQVVQESPPIQQHPPQTGVIEIVIAPSEIRTVQVRWKVPGGGGRALPREAIIHAGAVVSISGPGIQ